MFSFLEQQKIFCLLYLNCVQYPIRPDPTSFVSQSVIEFYITSWEAVRAPLEINTHITIITQSFPQTTTKCLYKPHTFHLADLVRATAPSTLVIKWPVNYMLKPSKIDLLEL